MMFTDNLKEIDYKIVSDHKSGGEGVVEKDLVVRSCAILFSSLMGACGRISLAIYIKICSLSNQVCIYWNSKMQIQYF